MTRVRRMGMLIALAVAVFPGASTAQPNREPTAEEKETARGLLDIGDEKLAAGDAKGALAAYEAADRIMGVPTTGIWVGKARIALGKLVEARDVLLRVKRYAVSPNEPKVFAEAREEATQLATDLAARIPTLTIRAPRIDGIVVTLDGRRIDAEVDLPRRLNPGKHVITATAPGYKNEKQTVELSEGDKQSVSLDLREVTSTKTKGESETPPKPDEPSSGVHWLVPVGFSVGGAGLLAGAICGGIALQMSNKLEEECGGTVCSPRKESNISTATALSHVSTAGFVVAGVGVALGVVGLFLPPPSSGDAALRFDIGPNGAFLSLHGEM